MVVDEVDGARIQLACWSFHKLASLLVVSDGNVARVKDVFSQLGLSFFVQPVLYHAVIIVITRS